MGEAGEWTDHLPLGPCFGRTNTDIVVYGVELRMVCENEIVPFCLGDRRDIFFPAAHYIRQPGR
jgi:hypothetical protein